MKRIIPALSLLLTCLFSGAIARGLADEPTKVPPASPPVPYLTAEEEAKKFVLPEGYSLELVVGDPIIKEPVVAVFDGNGRMFVAEMRSYMQDIDGKDEHAAKGRISMHWSSKQDGVFDRHTVFLDDLVLPRMMLPLGDGLLVTETDSDDIWLYHDKDGDGEADTKVLFYAGGKRGGNLEHQSSGLIWDRDNWLYEAGSSYRMRLHGTHINIETTPANSGQWGLSQDDYGKLWFVNAGGELGPVNFQEPIVYGAFSARGEPSPSFMEVWPLVGLADVEGGPHRFRPEDKTLNHFTACCGPDIFRGDRLPADLRGDLLFAEPVGRLIRRAKVEEWDGITHLRNAYVKSEFIRSTDPNFRPVNMVTAPDGTLYIVDMYRGIIQEGDWVRKDSYLRKVVQQYQLDKNFGRGRIWRLRHKDFQPGPEPHMLSETSTQLVSHLTHPNGWWRDTAQKLLVLRGDKSVVPALTKMARSHPDPLACIDALWTLEGMDALDPALIRKLLKNKQPQVRVAAIRVSESLFKKGDQSLLADVRQLVKDPDPNVVIQTMMTANLLKWPDAKEFIQAAAMDTNSAVGVRDIGLQLLQPARSFREKFTGDQLQTLERGAVIYQELCFSCHGTTGRGMPFQGGPTGATMAPPLAGSRIATDLREGIINILLKGLNGANNGKTYPAQMVPMESNNDQWIAAIASYVRNSFGNSASFVEAADVARARVAAKGRTEPWKLDELRAILPQPLTNHAQWKATASHNSKSALLAIDGDILTRYDSKADEVPGMWYQIELPRKSTITGLQLDAGDSRHYPRGCKVELSDDGQHWGQPVASGQGKRALTEIFFPPAQCRFIRITQTGSSPGVFWFIYELTVFEPIAPIKN